MAEARRRCHYGLQKNLFQWIYMFVLHVTCYRNLWKNNNNDNAPHKILYKR
jgi:hypothetical protein